MSVINVDVECVPVDYKVGILALSDPVVQVGKIHPTIERGDIMWSELPYDVGNGYFLIQLNQTAVYFRINDIVLLDGLFIDLNNPTQEEKDNLSMIYPFAKLEQLYGN